MILGRFFRSGEAVSALEYAILVGVIVAMIASALVVFSDSTTPLIEDVGAKVGAIRAPDVPKLSP